eukprot:3933505-Lingulodinium_polyedra.AAC.1
MIVALAREVKVAHGRGRDGPAKMRRNDNVAPTRALELLVRAMPHKATPRMPLRKGGGHASIHGEQQL